MCLDMKKENEVAYPYLPDDCRKPYDIWCDISYMALATGLPYAPITIREAVKSAGELRLALANKGLTEEDYFKATAQWYEEQPDKQKQFLKYLYLYIKISVADRPSFEEFVRTHWGA